MANTPSCIAGCRIAPAAQQLAVDAASSLETSFSVISQGAPTTGRIEVFVKRGLDLTKDLTGPQAIVLSVGFASAAALGSFVVRSLSDLIKSGCQVEIDGSCKKIVIKPDDSRSKAA